MADPNNYGPIAQIVTASGCAVAAAVAIRFNWAGRTKWEPAEEELEKGGRKITGLLNAICIALVWYFLRYPEMFPTAARTSIVLAAICLTTFILYSFLIAVFTYSNVVVINGAAVAQKVIGGFWLRPEAKRIISEKNKTVQEVFMGAAYDFDKLWSRPSRALAKVAFLLCYVALVFTGTVALACASVLLGDRVDKLVSGPLDNRDPSNDFANFPQIDQITRRPLNDLAMITFSWRNESRQSLDLIVLSCYAYYAKKKGSDLKYDGPLETIITIPAGGSGRKTDFGDGDNWVCFYVKVPGQDAVQPLICRDIAQFKDSELAISDSGDPKRPYNAVFEAKAVIKDQ